MWIYSFFVIAIFAIFSLSGLFSPLPFPNHRGLKPTCKCLSVHTNNILWLISFWAENTALCAKEEGFNHIKLFKKISIFKIWNQKVPV